MKQYDLGPHVTTEEFDKAMTQMKDEKAPRCDNINGELTDNNPKGLTERSTKASCKIITFLCKWTATRILKMRL